MATTLIIPDIHTKFVIAELIIEKEKPDKIVFLGDYFDNYDDGVELTIQTAEWLKNSMLKSNRIHLLGNHDNSYRVPSKYACSGYQPIKAMVINNKVKVDLNKLKHFTIVGDWLCTHAGLTKGFYKQYSKNKETPIEMLERMSNDEKMHESLYSVSSLRGGYDENPGIIWCDSREFEPIQKLKQIFGHTVSDEVRSQGDNHCIDTVLHNYAVYNDKTKELLIKRFEYA